MDVFGTTIAVGGVILNFIAACAVYSGETASLRERFEWDLLQLKAVADYFEQKKAQDANQQLAPGDAALLEQTVVYLDNLMSEVQRTLHKLQRKGLLNGIANRDMWIARQADLKIMEAEIYKWTGRFNLRVLGLPQELRPAVLEIVNVKTPHLIRSNKILHGILNLDSSSKEKLARMKRLKDSNDLAARIARRGDACFMPMRDGDKQLILASCPVPPEVISTTPSFDKLEFEIGILATALGLLDEDTGIRLLRVKSYFYHALFKQFVFTHVSPYPVEMGMSLLDVIKHDFSPPTEREATLDGCFTLALKLAEAVFFLHTAGLVHKNITSSSVVALRRPGANAGSIDDCYLMSFNLICRVPHESSIKDSTGVARMIWDFDIFQHPDRLRGKDALRYTKAHDVYSLGVLLLEIGCWEPLERILRESKDSKPSSWKSDLLEAASMLGTKTGTKYQRLVVWCLSVDGNEVITESMFVEHVLDPLEGIVNALS
ncbi:hypothetical protein GGR51DRAFT_563740 [Nemania sp. FL0031]|nr:hypothetical protein GGR51DRAFT_563740 [Nemania sp. FL0031]